MTTGPATRRPADRLTIAFLAGAVLGGVALAIASFHPSSDPAVPGSPSLVAQTG
ncbi:MAG: hypothetical protein ACRDYB_13740 [Acidimicrobiales bacterium]